MFFSLGMMIIINSQAQIKEKEVTFDCYDGGQYQMTMCSFKEYQYYDSLLNVLYKKVMKDIGPALKQQVLESQRSWLKMKNQNRDVIGNMYEGGSISPMLQNMQMRDDTKSRIHFLKKLDFETK